DKTRTVVVANVAMHSKYGKFVRTRTVLHVHDQANTSRLGDLVEVKACPPKSKTKRWELVRVVQQGVGLRFEGVEAPGADDKPAPAAPAKAPAKTEKKK
ncbi:MAG: 30S ribosomal protein S17, partial [Phycisphaerales bacterium]|nr:30S ribosomal protein S17 [Phycisphaerales bacterium]